MKEHIGSSHPNAEDTGTICALLRAMKLSVWGDQESNCVSMEQEKEPDGKGQTKRAKGSVRISRCIICIFYIHSFFTCSSILCCWQQGWKEEEEERGGV